jgi:hypothetical protein
MTLLVCLAASFAMSRVNLLLPTAGCSPDSDERSYAIAARRSDRRFIDAGVIIRRNNIAVGVTTGRRCGT